MILLCNIDDGITDETFFDLSENKILSLIQNRALAQDMLDKISCYKQSLIGNQLEQSPADDMISVDDAGSSSGNSSQNEIPHASTVKNFG